MKTKWLKALVFVQITVQIKKVLPA